MSSYLDTVQPHKSDSVQGKALRMYCILLTILTLCTCYMLKLHQLQLTTSLNVIYELAHALRLCVHLRTFSFFKINK